MQGKQHEDFMRIAIRLSEQNVSNSLGGPFGAVIVKEGKIVGKSANKVTRTLDPTAHAEVSAIRIASKKLKTFDLSGCLIYTSCEPCPMCLSAIYWARIDKIYFANTKDDACKIGFDDQFIYNEMALPRDQRKVIIEQMLRDEALNAFRLWDKSPMKISY
ncbi:MAG: nucleoside deaminase [Daejeonella sp.]|uniref:nucleoside deaminase n=1 Tax=Daejeonella sp. JGW-45 TaxID=3034148 RepID=UPI0023EC5465|nr:nucleoside deaminase [Daejeonella sp. JGW-45]